MLCSTSHPYGKIIPIVLGLSNLFVCLKFSFSFGKKDRNVLAQPGNPAQSRPITPPSHLDFSRPITCNCRHAEWHINPNTSNHLAKHDSRMQKMQKMRKSSRTRMIAIRFSCLKEIEKKSPQAACVLLLVSRFP